MNFVYPSFLFALSAIAIPIIIHLIQLRKYKRIYFSNVKFLQNIEQEQRKSNKLKNLLILLARILTLIFLVLAFAQPYIPQKQGINVTGKKYVSVYIDNSFSMERQGQEGSLLDEAKRKAKEIANAFQADDKFQLIGNELNGNQMRWLSKDDFLDALSELKIRPESKTISKIQESQSTLLNEVNAELKYAFIISDFQNSFYKNQNDAKIDTSISWNYVFLKNNNASNVSIDSVWFISPIHQPNSVEKMLLKFSNHSEQDIQNLNYDFKINKQLISKGSVNIAPNASTVDTFIYKNKAIGYQEAEIILNDQGVSFDNKYFFSYEVHNFKKVCIISEDESAKVIENVFETEPFFQYKIFSSRNIDYQYLQSSNIVFLNNVSQYSSGLAEELKKFVSAGNTLVLFPSENEINNNQSFSNALSLYSYSAIVESNNKIEKLNKNSTLYQGVFQNNANDKLDLPSVIKHFVFAQRAQFASQDILWLENNESVLKYYPYKSGHIYQFAFQLTSDYSDIAKHAIIVPTFLRMASVHYADAGMSNFIGQTNTIPVKLNNVADNAKKELIKGNIKIIPEIKSQLSNSYIYLADQIREDGIYTLKINDQEISKIAFNYNREESKMSFLELNDLEDLANEKLSIWESNSSSLTKLIKDESLGKRFWKICVILALVFIGLEILLIRAFK